MSARPGDRHGRAGGHEEVWLLLPWYVNASLEDDERVRVEEHLEACGICREEVRYWGEAASLLSEEGELAVSPAAGLERLRGRLGAEEEERGTRPALGPRLGGRLRTLFHASPPAIRWALAAQLGAIVVLAGLLASPLREPAPASVRAPSPAVGAFHTLSDPPAAPAPDGAPRFRVVFTDRAREREIRGALISVGGRIVDGPSPTGVYTIEVEPAEGEIDPPAVLRSLRSLPQVLLAEPAVSGS